MSKFLQKLFGSRRFTMVIATALVALFQKKLGIDISQETMNFIIGLVAAVVLGESYKDGQAAKNGAAIPPVPPTK